MMLSEPFRPDYAPDDEVLAQRLLDRAALPAEAEARIDHEARALIGAIRDEAAGIGGIGGIDALLREYSLTTPEGLALMVLAEALLRVPDDATADRLIEDRLGQGGFAEGALAGETLLVNASAWALGVSARLIGPTDTPEGILGRLARRIGLPAVRAAMRQAMRIMGGHFVLGQTIQDALARAGSRSGRVYRYSFDMLGEGARTAEDATRYASAYAQAIEAIGRAAGNAALPDRPGISVKLSALHPRYVAVQRDRVMAELVPRAITLAQMAAARGLNFTIDAEEADRLELSMDVTEAILKGADLPADWRGFGLAVQAYGKRAEAAIAHLAGLAAARNRPMMLRLVKGAYWDSEIKRAQERGLADFPVFSRKAMTDLNYLACAEALLARRGNIYPQFATHNALTVATVLERAGGIDGYEFQRLHGMGDALYDCLIARHPGIGVRTYAPVGQHRELLAYLVRRLLENGANSSFVSIAADSDVPVEHLLRRPAAILGSARRARHAGIRLPADLFGARRNSPGIEFGHAASLEGLRAEITAAQAPAHAAPLINGATRAGAALTLRSPIDAASVVGQVVWATARDVQDAITHAQAGFAAWGGMEAQARAAVLDRAADALRAQRGRMLALLCLEAGKTLEDGIAEWREAIDFLRYYADQCRRCFAAPETLPGPVGEENILRYRGRGVFAAIAPWNFPLAIFLGQVAAALAAGNAVIAKPAPQTPLIAQAAVQLLRQAGVPAAALACLPGDGALGAALIAHPAIAGVVFTGSTATAQAINRALAAKDGPIVPLIAETGGINAMIVDATALPEQVVDDAILSAFRSAGQRCSALRLLFVQEDIADRLIAMLCGAAAELRLGDPRDPATDIGPVIDAAARARLLAHVTTLPPGARIHHKGSTPDAGYYVAPHIIELAKAADLRTEIFGPILHVVRYRAGALDQVLEAIAATGYGLTLGVHTRIASAAAHIAQAAAVGNVYVNRNMIGAVVGAQPFGGMGLSGTGPKAGGADYLRRFAVEQVVSTNTAAAGGNAALLSSEE